MHWQVNQARLTWYPFTNSLCILLLAGFYGTCGIYITTKLYLKNSSGHAFGDYHNRYSHAGRVKITPANLIFPFPNF